MKKTIYTAAALLWVLLAAAFGQSSVSNPEYTPYARFAVPVRGYEFCGYETNTSSFMYDPTTEIFMTNTTAIFERPSLDFNLCARDSDGELLWYYSTFRNSEEEGVYLKGYSDGSNEINPYEGITLAVVKYSNGVVYARQGVKIHTTFSWSGSVSRVIGGATRQPGETWTHDFTPNVGSPAGYTLVSFYHESTSVSSQGWLKYIAPGSDHISANTVYIGDNPANYPDLEPLDIYLNFEYWGYAMGPLGSAGCYYDNGGGALVPFSREDDGSTLDDVAPDECELIEVWPDRLELAAEKLAKYTKNIIWSVEYIDGAKQQILPDWRKYGGGY
jgi:hypothetical protein